MNKAEIVQEIVAKLSADLLVLSKAASAAHAAATHEECLPDNKYDTTALEASYIAQGQANRAQEIRIALESYRKLELHDFTIDMPIRLTALVTLEGEDGSLRHLFVGPQAGGLKIAADDGEVVVVTPAAPLGRSLLGLRSGDEVTAGSNLLPQKFTVVAVS